MNLNNPFLCVLLIYTIFKSLFCISQKCFSLIRSNPQLCSCWCMRASVSWSIRTAVTNFSLSLRSGLFEIYCSIIDLEADKKLIIHKNSCLSWNVQKEPKMGSKQSSLGFRQNLSLLFAGSKLKWKDITILWGFFASHRSGKLWFISYWPKCSRPIRLQGSLINNIFRSNSSFFLVFWMYNRPKKGSIWGYYFVLGCQVYPLYPNLPWLTKNPFG